MKNKNITNRLSLKAISYKLKASRGFTIIETMVAIGVLMLAITAPLTIAQRALSSAEIARREVTASYLAQEAIEYIRNIKDSNAIAGLGGTSTWLSGLDSCMGGAECGVDPTSDSNQIILCSEANNQDCLLYQYTDIDDALQGIFGHRTTAGWTASPYTRKVSVVSIDADTEARVTATVHWADASDEGRSVVVSSSIFNWYDSN